MGRHAVESILGAVVLVVAGLFIFFAYSTAEVRKASGYPVKAVFYKVGGLKKGSDVRINGIKVGSVTDLSLNTTTFDADVTLLITPEIKLPKDTQASIASEGILGGLYVRLDPGHDQGFLAEGETLSKTKDFRSLEDQVGEIIFLATGSSDSPK